MRCAEGGRAATGTGARTSVTSRGGALPVMWLEAGRWGGKAGLGGGEEMRGCSEREEMRGVPELRAKAYLDPGVGGRSSR